MKISVRDVDHLPFKTKFPGLVFDTPGNSYDTKNWPEVTDEDVTRWHMAGFISVDGAEDGSPPDPTRRVILTPDKVKSIITGGASNG